ncbi:hypothetical protein I6G82_09030 [Lysinibacillus macroides]|uniref:Uncharacterized protein n=1 Tax=Lysinibacillus macroides TaxID=33935 RepID=A0A0M9DGR9_9BACI|nr:hypothetical protein [Lysinibacillus macroides]KOY80569.1 hypothetical protein ADM90_15275 [Lysinibacillus macroides]QPR69704.1 hypothetical protein I6G82_09030 [Lysinibacillus macroides]
MRIVQLTLFYLAIILVGMALLWLSIALTIFAGIALAIIYRHIHIVYRTNNMKMADKLVKRRQKEPIFAGLYAMAYDTKKSRFTQWMPLSSYAYCYITALEGRTADMCSDKWMHPTIEAVYAYTLKDQAMFRQFADASIEQARGMQKYSLICNFKQMEQVMMKAT